MYIKPRIKPKIIQHPYLNETDWGDVVLLEGTPLSGASSADPFLVVNPQDYEFWIKGNLIDTFQDDKHPVVNLRTGKLSIITGGRAVRPMAATLEMEEL